MNKAEVVVGMKQEGNSRKRKVQNRIEKKCETHWTNLQAKGR